MNKYLIFTSEGYCEDPCGDSIENCQYLGRLKANSKEEAVDKFFNEEEWLRIRGYSRFCVTVVQLADNESI